MIERNIPERLLLLCLLALLLTHCANPVSPVGGPKDEDPPEITRAEPPLLSRNFNSEKVRIWFDEYVQFKELNQQLVISPPMDEKPEFKIKGKSIVIEFQEALKENTTYNIFFGDAVVDITEGNPIPNFQYVFSTGNVLDSLTFKGSVVDAFTLDPVPGLNVMLYLDNNDTLPFDSLPYYVKPYYLSKSSESGEFQFNNLLDRDFKIFVLEDGNTNMLFDQVTERIAYSDSLIHPYYIPPPPAPDTTADSTVVVVDTTYLFDEPDPITMRLFQEFDSVQRFIKATLVKPGKLMFVYKTQTSDPGIYPLNVSIPDPWYLEELNKTGDTINFWLTQEVPDTLTFVVADRGKILDTVDVSTVERTKKRKGRDKDDPPKAEKIVIKWGNKTELNTGQRIRFGYPIRQYNLEGSLMIENEDTLAPIFRITDSLGLVGEFTHDWKEGAVYKFMIPDSAFFDIGGRSHDTLRHTMQTKNLSDYGNLYINTVLTEGGTNHMVQLFKGEKMVDEQVVLSDQKISFEYLLPDDYRVKVIIDRNGNRRWDPGHYILGIQPEPVQYFPKVITIRANWDVVEDWNIGN